MALALKNTGIPQLERDLLDVPSIWANKLLTKEFRHFNPKNPLLFAKIFILLDFSWHEEELICRPYTNKFQELEEENLPWSQGKWKIVQVNFSSTTVSLYMWDQAKLITHKLDIVKKPFGDYVSSIKRAFKFLTSSTVCLTHNL